MDSVTDPVTSSWKNIIDIHLLVVGRSLALIASYLIISTWRVTIIVYRCTSNIFVLDNKRFQCCMIRGKSLQLVFSKKTLFMYKAWRVGQCFFVNIWKMKQINQPILKRHQAIRTKNNLPPWPHGPMLHTMFMHQVDFNIFWVFGLVS